MLTFILEVIILGFASGMMSFQIWGLGFPLLGFLGSSFLAIMHESKDMWPRPDRMEVEFIAPLLLTATQMMVTWGLYSPQISFLGGELLTILLNYLATIYFIRVAKCFMEERGYKKQ
jgi:hypothetical protein